MKHISLRNQIILFSTILLLLFVQSGFAVQDTTRSPTRIVPKKKEPVQVEVRDDCSRCGRDDEDEEGDFWADLIYAMVRVLVWEPMKGAFQSIPGVSPFNDTQSRWGIGLSLLDYHDYPGIASASGQKASFNYLHYLGGYVAFREHVALNNGVGEFYCDFERDVFVDGELIGQETDVGKRYYHRSIQAMSELMIRPYGPDGWFYFTLGGGPQYVNEKFEGTRKYSYKSTREYKLIEDWYWVPTFSTSIGALFPQWGTFGSLEIKYSLGVNRFSREGSLPGDNFRYVHGISALEYQVLF